MERLTGFLLPLIGPVFGFHRLLLPSKYLRSRGHVLNVFRFGDGRGSALEAGLLPVRLPGTGWRIPFTNLKFPSGNFLCRNGMMSFLRAICAFLERVPEFGCSGVSVPARRLIVLVELELVRNSVESLNRHADSPKAKYLWFQSQLSSNSSSSSNEPGKSATEQDCHLICKANRLAALRQRPVGSDLRADRRHWPP